MKTGHVRDSRSLMQCLDRLTENKSAIRSDAIQEVILLARNASFHNSDLEEYEETALSGLLTCIRKSPDIPTTISAFRAISLIAINSTSSMLLSFQDLLGLAPSMYRTTALTVTASFVEALTTCLVFSTEDVFDFYEPMLTFCANILSRRMTSESKKVFFPTTTKNPLSPSCTPNILIDECDTDGDMDGNVPEEQSEATTSSSEIETKREKKPPRRGKRKAKALQTHPSQQSTEHPKITHPDVHEISQTPHLSNTPRSHTPKSSLSQYNTNSDTSFDIFRHQSESPSGTATSRKHTPPLPSPSPVYQITLSNTTTVIKLSRQNENSARSHLVTRTFDALSFFFSVLGFRFPQSHHFLEFAGRYLVDPSPDVRIAASNLIAIFETIGERENENPNHIDDDAVINWAKAALSALSQESVHQKSKKDRSEQRKAMRSVLRFLEDGNEPTQTFRSTALPLSYAAGPTKTFIVDLNSMKASRFVWTEKEVLRRQESNLRLLINGNSTLPLSYVAETIP
ncbi:hypothetical protein BLNAU_15438 [Blattamonas nauphoetae]|uniref:Interferon-related developmental regulator N-terminal domain-containing protein n=1 Tax=Blattamonas nauphoetae TaxID=2049346 RepID=A0ABQ9XE64_9EUKA|nr:hypothetical protein BLNAU_15438 [Blattamonas nauphoetae]